MSAKTIQTLANGKGIDLLNPKASDVDWDSYAEGLAKEKRYNGATPGEEYSVAEHCCRGTDAIIQETGDTLLAAYFLIHDAHEAVLKDLTTPRKRAIGEICQEQFGVLADQVITGIENLEYRHDVAIHEAAGLMWPSHSAMQAAIKHWDLVMFVSEWRDLMLGVEHPNWAPYAHVEPLPYKIRPWPWQIAKQGYLRRAGNLLPALKRPFNDCQGEYAHGETMREHAGSSS